MFQLGGLAILTLLVILFLDSQFRVLPSSIHGYMPAHHAGLVITDMTITKCSTINLFTSCKLDPTVWHRIEKDLYLGTGWVSSAYVHVQQKAEAKLTPEDFIVVDVSVGKLNPSSEQKRDKGGNWEKRPGGLWVKRSANLQDSDSKKAVTAADVLFGADAVDPRDGWHVIGTPFILDTAGEGQEPRLSIRRGKPNAPSKPKPRIDEQGKFKIMQVADLHFSTGTGICRDPMPEGLNNGKCEADPRTLDFVERLLDTEKPDLVILSGDQVNGETAPDAQSVSLLPDNHISSDFARPSSNMPNLLSNAKYPSLLSLATTMTKAPCIALSKWLLLRHCPTLCPSPVPKTSTALGTTIWKS